MVQNSRNFSNSIRWVVFLGLWQVASPSLFAFAIPGPIEILVEVVSSHVTILRHLLHTLVNGIGGLFLGITLGTIQGYLMHKSSLVRILTFGPSLALFSLPAIALAQLLVLVLPNHLVPVLISASMVLFPTSVMVQRGLAEIDGDQLKLFRLYQSGFAQRFKSLEIPALSPAMLTALQLALPWALLGAMLGEFVGGRWGLGILMLGMLSTGSPAKLWAIAVVATVVAHALYSWTGTLGRKLRKRLNLNTFVADPAKNADVEFLDIRSIILTVLATLVFWQAISWLSSLPAPLMLGPIDLSIALWHDSEAQSRLARALLETIPLTILAVLLGTLTSMFWAFLAYYKPEFGKFVTPIILITQSVPLLALTPVISLTFGRGVATTIIVALLATIFPAYLAIYQRLVSIPLPVAGLMRLYKTTARRRFWYVELPWSFYGIATAIKISAPRALLGVMLAEYLLTGTGLGFLLATAQGRLAFVEVWAIVAIGAIVSLVLHFVFNGLERRLKS